MLYSNSISPRTVKWAWSIFCLVIVKCSETRHLFFRQTIAVDDHGHLSVTQPHMLSRSRSCLGWGSWWPKEHCIGWESQLTPQIQCSLCKITLPTRSFSFFVENICIIKLCPREGSTNLHVAAFLLLWPWPLTHDLETWPWPRYSRDISPHRKQSCHYKGIAGAEKYANGS